MRTFNEMLNLNTYVFAPLLFSLVVTQKTLTFFTEIFKGFQIQ